MNKVLEGLETVFWVASVILFIYWIVTKSPTEFPLENISGWWWFSTVLTATFLSEYNSN